MGKQKARRELTESTILDAALSLAGEIGIEAFTIRGLADKLGAAPMSIYYYFKSKEAIIDGMVERVFGEIELPPEEQEWKEAARIRCDSFREVLNRHPWAAPLMESRRNPGPVSLKHHDAVIGCFSLGGFSLELAAKAVALTDAFVYGFALQEASLPGGGGKEMKEMGASLMEDAFLPYPHLMKMTGYALSSSYRFADLFDFGLNLILEGLEKESFKLQ